MSGQQAHRAGPGWFTRVFAHGLSGWVTLITYIFMLAPIVVLIAFAFNAGRSTVVWTGFSLDWFEVVWNNRHIARALQVSLIVAVASAAISTATGALAAVAITRRQFLGRDALGAALAAPLVLPEIVLGVALLVFMSFMGVTLGYGTMIIGHVLVSLPFSTLIVRAAASSLDLQLENAAADLGANEWQTFRMVTLPQLMPAIFTAFILSATLSFDNLVMSTFTSGVGTTTLPLRIYSMLKLGITPEINALGTLLVVANVAILFLVMGRYLPLMLKTSRR
ncbi:MAG: ABC transporter permease [Alphaproteobacteria bacterium]|nr:ABC transporter permease [Alphaproteobacteria bacterium]MBU0805384.1 ABC transporter permease [Alphaproteobacteria bacterium]MBU0873330.1 ABC transporter permease [Alphaproteobacteria bacterium]MBU1401442.1 ABC transporter permease [Alphaproteobacteria bacterium]MBU1592141.1 ABC transporter permease [Alphaproteobacteria bacterium]